MRRRYTVEERTKFLAEVQATGHPVKEVADRLGVSVSTAYLWAKHTLTRDGHRSPTAKFARVVPKSTLSVRVGAAVIEVSHGFDPELLRSVVEALGETA